MAVLKNYCILFIAIIFLFEGCASSNRVTQKSTSFQKETAYTIIFVIHADSDYLFHQNGRAYQADKEALGKATDVAINAHNGEVFIFHQKPKKKTLWLFPKKSRQFLHYKNGALVERSHYSSEDGGFEAEAIIYKANKNSKSDRNIFVYLGHEIPSYEGRSYHQSQPKHAFNSFVFANSLKEFEPNFDLTILSTCNNGNLQTAHELLGITEVLLASPQNLHLSYLDFESLSLLENEIKPTTLALADSIGESSFNRLSNSLQTAVTVSVYDMNRLQPMLESTFPIYQKYLQTISKPVPFADNLDCANLKSLQGLIDSAGVHTYFRPAMFGRKSNQTTHSGWGCKE
ncbi:MAG: hypothetical protein WC967_09990 [Balneolaceae bacterium]